MHFSKNSALLFCLMITLVSFGMKEKAQKVPDQQLQKLFSLRYTDDNMIEAIKENNIPRITYLLQRAELHKKIFKKTPISPRIIVEAIDWRNKEIIALLLEHNVPLDGKAINAVLGWQSKRFKDFYETPEATKRLVELLLHHNAPLDDDALYNAALFCESEDIFELLLQHNAPLGEKTLDLLAYFNFTREKEIELCVKYKPATYTHIIELARQRRECHKPVLKKIFWYVDNTALKEVDFYYIPEYYVWNFIQWFNQGADVENMYTVHDVDQSYSATLLMLTMCNVTPPKAFSKLLVRLQQRNPTNIYTLLKELAVTNRDANLLAFESLVTLWVENASDETILNKGSSKEFDFDRDIFNKKPVLHTIVTHKLEEQLSTTLLKIERKNRMDEKFMHHSMYENVTFTFN